MFVPKAALAVLHDDQRRLGARFKNGVIGGRYGVGEQRARALRAGLLRHVQIAGGAQE
jgi:hypothetical protein